MIVQGESIGMFEKRNNGKWAFFWASLLVSVPFLLFFYSKNAPYVTLKLVGYVCLTTMAISAVGYGITFLIFRSPLSAFGFCVTAWIGCFICKTLTEILGIRLGIRQPLFVAVLIIIMISIICAFLLKRISITKPAVGLFFCLMIGFLLIFNLMTAVSASRRENMMAIIDVPKGEQIYKSEFNIASDQQIQPNIYWIHCDGMLGFDAMKKYYGESLTSFQTSLEERGFFVNQSASLEVGHYTMSAIPTLMSPYFYDTYLHEIINTYMHTGEVINVSADERLNKAELLYTDVRFAWPLWTMLYKVRLHNELLEAFGDAGYYRQTISIFGRYFFPTVERFIYPDGKGIKELGEISQEQIEQIAEYKDLQGFLHQAAMPLEILQLKLWNMDEEKNHAFNLKPPLTDDKVKDILLSDAGVIDYGYMINGLASSLQVKNKPKFTLVMNLIPHYPYQFNETGEDIHGPVNLNLSDFPPHYKYAAETLCNMVDMILSDDPDAVIILQADHGLHGNTAQEIRDYFAEIDYDLDIWNNVMSAVRIPEAFKTGEENVLHDPRNIARYLVNNYVGQNYTYLLYE